jgi:hypothetical protein
MVMLATSLALGQVVARAYSEPLNSRFRAEGSPAARAA